MLSCYSARDGKKLWDQDLAMECHASPTLVGNRLYLVGTKGLIVVAEAGPAFKELFRGDLEEKVFASPAFAEGRIFLRGVSHLFALGLRQAKLASNH